MPGDDFRKDMDSYLKKRNSSDDYHYLHAEQTEPEPEKPDEVEEEYVAEDDVDESPEQKGFLAKIKGFFSSGTKEDEPVDEENPHAECREDIKELGKITIAVVKTLPHNELMDFKESHQYENLRRILRKYKLIKPE